MSTRAQVIIKDDRQKIWFYRHSDGYPERTLPTLNKFLDWVKQGKIRNNVEQSAGWLILIGAEEYGTSIDFNPNQGWKCGAYEPCACHCMHGDIEYLYTIDLQKQKITYKEV